MIAPSRSYRVASYIQAAERQGYRLLIVSDSKHSLIPAVSSGITIDFHQPDQALEIIKATTADKTIVAVIATDDLVVTLASRIAEHLGLPHNRAESAQLTRRKDLARQRLQQSGCNVPEFQVIGLDNSDAAAADLPYPVVLKPLMLSGSRGVIRANNASEFQRAANDIRQILHKEPGDAYERSHMLVEGYLDGTEVAVDGFVQNGEFRLLALFDKPEPLTGPYFEESFYITPSRHSAQLQQAIIDEITRCCHAYGLQHGPVHAEARITEQGIFLIEMASRTIGGQCAQIIDDILGMSLEEVIIQMSCQDPVDITAKSTHAGVLMIPIRQSGVLKRVEGQLSAGQVQHITRIEIHIQPGYELVPLPRGASYLGFIFARARDYHDTLDALRQAHQQLKFITTESWNIDIR